MAYAPLRLIAEPAAASPVAGLPARLVARLRAARWRRRARRDYEWLLGADDHILADVGVTRAALRAALSDLDRQA